MALVLTHDERTDLEGRLRSRKIRAEDARRARGILMLADGASYSMIEATVPCYRDFINRWRRRFLAKRVAGLQAGHYSQPPSVLTPAMEARILEKTRQAPPDGSTHWSTRKLARSGARYWVIACYLSDRPTRFRQSGGPEQRQLEPTDHLEVSAFAAGLPAASTAAQ